MPFFPKLARGSADSKPRSVAPSDQQKQSYRGVEVIPHSSGHCAAVEEIAGYRILADEAPPLPLPACDYDQCKCRYAQYRDRRMDLRRDADVGIGGVASMLHVDSGRSDAPGRRADDGGED